MGNEQYAIEMLNITKRIPGIIANATITPQLRHGEIHALLGENGAGKSTLVKVMTGIYQPDEGEILYKAIPVHLPTPESAHKMGITAIHQETVLFDELSVTENIFVGQYLHKGFLKKLDWPEMHRRAQAILARLEVQIDPRATLKTLSIAQRHMVAIARALMQQAKVILADEPIASLDPESARIVMDTLRDINQNDGITVVVTLHQVDYALRYCERIVALCQGHVFYDGSSQQFDNERFDHLYRSINRIEENAKAA